MSYALTPDFVTLPEALLPIAKDHMRVDFADDDASIMRYVSGAVSYFQHFTGLAVFGGSVAWAPPLTTGASRYETPFKPVAKFTITSVQGGGNVAALYELQAGALTEPVWLARKDGTAFHPDSVIALAVGHVDETTMDPAMLATILRIAATLYEQRESISAISLEQVPFWLNDMMTGFWVPRA